MKKWNPDPVEFLNGKWIFWDETWSYSYGPYESEEEARTELKKYAISLDSLYDDDMSFDEFIERHQDW